MHPAFATAIALFALLGHGYFWVAIVNRLHAWAGPRRFIDFATYASFAAFVCLPFLVAFSWATREREFFVEDSNQPIARFALIYLLGCGMFGLGKLLARFVSGFREDDPQTILSKKREVPAAKLTRAEHLVGWYPRLVGIVPGNQVLSLAIENKRLLVPRLPKELEKMRIAHISDLHITGRVGAGWLEHVVDEINARNADVVMITGDLIEREAYRDWLTTPLKRLKARLGVYFILGNHDYFIDASKTATDLSALGLHYVGGTSITPTWNGVPVLIAGNEAPWNHSLAEIKPRSARDAFRLFLLHSPDQFDWACAHDADLALAGHTHGGQICFPILGAVAAPSLFGTRFANGTFRRGKNVMHVTRGISGETPMRWLCPPEVAILELVATAID